MSLADTFRIAASATVAQSQRLNTIASNLANAESTSVSGADAYRARQVVFRPVAGYGQDGAGVEVAAVAQSNAPLKRVYRPGHPDADASGYVTQSNVDPVEEMVNMVAASRSYQMNIQVMTNARQLTQRVIDLMRT